MRFNRQFSLFCVVALSVAMISSTAEAQRGGRGGGEGGPQGGGQRGGGGAQGGQRGGGGAQGGQRGGQQRGTPTVSRSQLLRSEDVQKELKVTDAQMDTIKEAMEAFRKDREGSRDRDAIRDAIRDMSREEQTALFKKMQEDAEKATKEADTVLEALLEPAQIERLDQIAFQVKSQAGLAALLQSEDVQKQLSMTDEQIAKVTGIQEKSEEASRTAMEAMRNRDNGGERPDFRAIMEEMQKKREESRKANDTAVMAVLTDAQKAKIEELKGEAFEVDMRSLMGRGGRGGEAGGRGGRGGEAGGRGGRGGEAGGRGGRGGEAGGRGGRGGEAGGRGGRGGRPESDDPELT